MKAQIFATDLQYRYIFEVDTQKEKTELENKYNEWWIKARTGLSTILDMELNFIERVNQNMNDFNSKKHYRTVKILFDLSLLLIKEKKKCYEYNMQGI